MFGAWFSVFGSARHCERARMVRRRALAISMSPSWIAVIASSAASKISVSVAPFATLLHAALVPRFSCDVAAPPFSPQVPNSSPEPALPLAPALSCDHAGPTFDSRRWRW